MFSEKILYKKKYVLKVSKFILGSTIILLYFITFRTEVSLRWDGGVAEVSSFPAR